MPQFRNLLSRKPAASDSGSNGKDENAMNAGNQEPTQSLNSPQGAAPVNFRKSREEVPNEYKLSVVNDSGVYLPPSPPEKHSFWPTKSSNTTSSNHRNLVDENEPFSISRESFDSYRRSFDISARSPVLYADSIPSRTSLDLRFSRSSTTTTTTKGQTSTTTQSMEEEAFEDVGLADEETKPKKRGLFARFGDNSSSDNNNNSNSRPTSSHLGFRLPGRKRGQSGQGAELVSYQVEVPGTEA